MTRARNDSTVAHPTPCRPPERATTPKDKVLEFKILKANTEGLERNDEEHKGVVKKLEAAGGFRVATTYRTGRAHGMTMIGEVAVFTMIICMVLRMFDVSSTYLKILPVVCT